MSGTIERFMREYGSFTIDGAYYMRGWADIERRKLHFMKDWFDVCHKIIDCTEIIDVVASENGLSFNLPVYGEERTVLPVTIAGYKAICDINDKIFSLVNAVNFESIIQNDDTLVDEEYSGKKDGVVYCVLDLFRLGRIDFDETVRNNRTEMLGEFSRKLARTLHINKYAGDTLTIYHACKEGKSSEHWYGLWSMTKQEPLNRVEFSEKISEKFFKKLLTFA